MRLQISIYDRINYYLLTASLILGVIFYDFIGERFGFTYIDEIFVSILAMYSVLRRRFSKEFFIFIGIALFYLLYSFMYPINTHQAILIDLVHKMYLNYEIGGNRYLSDTFFPSLAQFGYIGIMLYTLFGYRIFQTSKK